MDKKVIFKYGRIILPSVIFLVCVYALPVHYQVMLLMIPFLPIIIFCDACFYTMPCAIVLLLLWLIVSFVLLFISRGRKIIKKTKFVPMALIAVIVLGLVSTKISSLLIDANLPVIGIGAIE